MALTKVGKEGITGISNSSDATAITIDSSENVGIGTASPARTLTVNSHGGGNRVASITHTAGAYAFATFSDANTSNDGSVRVGALTNDLVMMSGGSEHMRMDSSGNVTMSSQPAFMAQPSSNQNDIAGDTNVDVLMGTEQYDVGSNFSSSTFTAPVTGKYFLSFTLYGVQLAGTANYMEMSIDTSNRNYTIIQEPSGTETVFAGGTVAVIADMDANDTANCRVTIGGSSTFDVTTSSRFTGALIC